MTTDVLTPEVLDSSSTCRDRRSIPLPVRMSEQPDGLGGRFLPDHADLQYHRWPGQPWVARVFLSGYRISATTGELSVTRSTRCYHHPDHVDVDQYRTRLPIPEFLMPFVEHYQPGGDQ